MADDVTKATMQISARGRALDLSSPKIMGILNVTPDSFSDGGRFNNVQASLKHIREMVDEGADIIDVGGESTSPGSPPVSTEDEINRVMPVLQQAISEFTDTLFSIDTTKYEVARAALQAGVHIINDISGLQHEPRLARLAAEYEAALVLMHMQGTPKNMQKNPSYPSGVVEEIYQFFTTQSTFARRQGVENIILDPGFGFGKTLAHNLQLLNKLADFRPLGYPLLAGISRKSMIGRILDERPAGDRLIGTVIAHYQALLNGANIIRVHDVKEAHDSLLVYQALHKY